jgi:L-ascorbate metabolism protein UlaG (beta-lactamase superfamily)
MKITHFGHACLLLETGDARILVTREDLHAVLVTHNHHDQFDKQHIGTLMDANPEATLIVERATADEAQESVDRERIHVVSAGESFNVKGIEIMAVGGTHAMIHPDIERTPTSLLLHRLGAAASR